MSSKRIQMCSGDVIWWMLTKWMQDGSIYSWINVWVAGKSVWTPCHSATCHAAGDCLLSVSVGVTAFHFILHLHFPAWVTSALEMIIMVAVQLRSPNTFSTNNEPRRTERTSSVEDTCPAIELADLWPLTYAVDLDRSYIRARVCLWGSTIGHRQHRWRFRVVAGKPRWVEHCRVLPTAHVGSAPRGDAIISVCAAKMRYAAN